MKATFTVDAFPGQRFQGSIVQIRNAATTVQNVVTYSAIIEFDNSDLKLRPGMTASVTITYAERNDVLAIPNAALRFSPPPEANLKAPERPSRARPDGSAPAHWQGASAEPASSASAAPAAESSVPGEARQRGSGRPSASDFKTVWIPKGTSAEAIMVRIGLTDGSFTELLSEKLKDGDKVVTDSTLNGKSTSTASGSSGGQSKPGGASRSPGMGRMF
jgi:HlyD family secretion protein